MRITPHLDINFRANQSCDVCRNEVQLALGIEPSDGFYGGTVCMTCLFLMRDQNLAVSDSDEQPHETAANSTPEPAQKQGGFSYSFDTTTGTHAELTNLLSQAMHRYGVWDVSRVPLEYLQIEAHLLLEVIHELRRARASQTYIYGEDNQR